MRAVAADYESIKKSGIPLFEQKKKDKAASKFSDNWCWPANYIFAVRIFKILFSPDNYICPHLKNIEDEIYCFYHHPTQEFANY